MARLSLLLSILVVLLAAREAHACAPAPRMGDHVGIEAEDAIIIWDDRAGVEHFIRRASFDTDAKDFGFIVPTPTKPELFEFDDAVFDRVRDITQNDVEIQEERELRPFSFCHLFIVSADESAPTEGVDVLHRQRVAGYDAVVLEAGDGEALAKWLGDNGYANTPQLGAWAQHYVEAGWVFTAFKMGSDEGEGFSTSAVRMAFSTDQPMYPYREPKTDGPRPPARALRVFFIAPGRYEGALQSGALWPGETLYARPLSEELVGASDFIPQGAWITEFLDHANPRPGDADVIFSRLENGAELRRTRTRMKGIPLPIDMIPLLALVALFVWRRRRKRRQSPSREG